MLNSPESDVAADTTILMHIMLTTTSSGDDHSSHLAEVQAPTQNPSENDGYDRSDAPVASSSIPKRGEIQKNWALLRKLHRATLVARRQHFPSETTAEADSGLEALRALQAVAKRGEAQKVQENWQRMSILQVPGFESLDSYAAPLSSLKERDVKALSVWFEREDMGEIATDVTCRLRQLIPEPCWEDDPFDFLKEFL
jgi:hypothetical protein